MIYYLQLYPSIELATAYYSSEKQQVNHEEQNERLIVYLKLFFWKIEEFFWKMSEMSPNLQWLKFE